MALQLESLIFDAQTGALEQAVKKIDDLSAAVTRLSRAQQDETKSAVQAEKVKQEEAKTAVASAKAKEAEAKAAAASAKAKEAEAKADTAATRAKQTSAKATKEVTDNTDALNKVLQRQKEMLEFMTQGYSRGQASTLAYAKATGAATSELNELGNVLQTQRKLIGGDVFDKSLSGLTALRNQLGEVREAYRQYGAGVELTRNQTRELARDKERIIERLKQEGASFTDIKNAIRQHGEEYIATAARVNALINQEKELERQHRESANAARALAAEEERMASIMQSMNHVVDSGTKAGQAAAQSIARYERNLRLAGVGAQEAATKLALYKKQMIQVQEIEQTRRAQHLSRALTPQISDVITSLAGGMPPHLVIMQQGLQIRDLISLSGVEMEKLQEVFRTSSADMIKSLTGTAQAVGTLLVGSIVSAGKAVVDFLWTPFDETIKLLKVLATQGVVSAEALDSAFKNAGAAISSAARVIKGGILAALVAVAGTMIYLDVQQTKISKSLNLYGASLGTTTASLLEMAVNSKYSTGIVIQGIEAVAKAGGFTADQLQMITESAARMNKVFGISVEDVVSRYEEVRKGPVKALLELQAQTGNVNTKVLEHIRNLVKQGDTYKAVEEAIKEYERALDKTADKAEETEGKTSGFIKKIKDAWSELFKDIQMLALIAAENIAYVFNGIGSTIGGAVAAAVAAAKGKFTEAKAIWEDMGRTSEENRVRIDAINARLLGRPLKNTLINQASEELDALKAKLEKFQNKGGTPDAGGWGLFGQWQSQEISDQIKVAEERLERLKGVQQQVTDAMNTPPGNTEVSALAQWELANQEIFSNALSAREKYLTEMKRLDTEYDKGVSLGASPEKLESIRKAQAKLTEDFNKSLVSTGEASKFYNKTIQEFQKMQVKASGATDDLSKAQTHLLNVMSDPEWDKLSLAEKEEVLTQMAKAHAIEEGAKAYEKQKKALEDLQKLFDDIDQTNLKRSQEVEAQNKELEFQYSLLGKSDDQIKEMTRNYEMQRKISEIINRYEQEKLKAVTEYNEKIKDVTGPDRIRAEKEFNDRMRELGINRENDIANVRDERQLQSLQEYEDEWKRIKGEIGDAVWIALTEGGRKGAKKVGDLLKEELRKIAMKPINLVVNLVMDTGKALLGMALNYLTGGSSGGGLGSTLGLVNNTSTAYTLMTIGSDLVTHGASVAYANYAGSLTGDPIGALIDAKSAASWFSDSTAQIFGKEVGKAAGTEMASTAGSATSAWANAANIFAGAASAYGVGQYVGQKYGYTAGTIAGTFAGVGTYAAGTAMATGTSFASALGSIPGWGWVAAAVVALVGALSGKKPKMKGDVITAEVSDGAFEVTDNEVLRKSLGKENVDALTLIASTFANTYNGILEEFGQEASYTLSALFRTRTNAMGSLSVNGEQVAGGKSKKYSLQKFFDDVMTTGIVNAVQMSDLPDQIKSLFETGVKPEQMGENIAAIVNMNRALKDLGTDLVTFIGDMNFDDFRQEGEKNLDVVSRAALSVINLNSALDLLGLTTLDVSYKSYDMSKAMEDAAGGQENLSEFFGKFFDAFGSDLQKFQIQADIFYGTMESLIPEDMLEGIDLQSLSVEGFKDLVDTLIQAGTESANAATGLLSMAEAFEGIQDAALGMLNISAESIAGIFTNAVQDAQTYQEAEAIARQESIDMFYNGFMNMMIGSVTDLVMGNIVGPMATNLVNAAAQSASIDVAGSSAAANAIVSGGTVSGATVAEGGRIAGNELAGIVDKAVAMIDIMVAIASSPEYQETISKLGDAFAPLGGAMWQGGQTIQSSWGVRSYEIPSGTPTTGGGGNIGGSNPTQNAEDAWQKLIDSIVKQTEDARKKLNQLNMTSYEIAVQDIQDKAEEFRKELDALQKGRSSNEVDEWVKSQLDLLNAQNAKRAAEIISGVNKEIDKFGKSEYDLAIMSITEKTKEYTDSLKDLGQATDENIAVVEKWAKGQLDLLNAQNAEKAADIISGINREIDRFGKSEYDLAIMDIVEKTKDYIDSLKALGQATDYNIAVVEKWSSIQMAQAGVTEAQRQLQKAIDAERKEMQERFDNESETLRERISAISDVISTLDAAIKAIEGTVEKVTQDTLESARSQLSMVIASVRSGADITQFKDIISSGSDTLTKNQTTLYSSRADFERQQRKSLNILEELDYLGGKQLTEAERQLELLENWYSVETNRLEDLINKSNEQLNALLGIDQSVLSVEDAINNLNNAILELVVAKDKSLVDPYVKQQVSKADSWGGSKDMSKASADDPLATEINKLYSSILGRDADVAGAQYYKESGMSLDQIAESISSSAEKQIRDQGVDLQNKFIQEVSQALTGSGTSIQAYANGGYYSGGLALVGEDGPELINFSNPGQVYTASQTANILSSGNTEEVVQELQALRAEVAMLRYEARATAINTSKSARILDDVSQGGTELHVVTTP